MLTHLMMFPYSVDRTLQRPAFQRTRRSGHRLLWLKFTMFLYSKASSMSSLVEGEEYTREPTRPNIPRDASITSGTTAEAANNTPTVTPIPPKSTTGFEFNSITASCT